MTEEIAITPRVGGVREPAECLAGGGAMGALMRSTDWGTTPLGPVTSWPQSLRTAVSICLGTSFPMMISWGPDLLLLYTDGYLPVLGTQKHPRALGQPLLECFSEIRDLIGPMFRGVLASGQAVGAEDMMFPLERNGYTEETYFVFSYSPIRDETGGVAGVLTTCTETTARVIGERRLRTLRALAEAAAHATTAEHAMVDAAGTLEPSDVPFALFYLVEEDGRSARRVASCGFTPEESVAPIAVSLHYGGQDRWGFGAVAASRRNGCVTDLVQHFGNLPGGPWPESPTQALVLPIGRPGQPHVYGFLVAGVSPRRALDESYRAYLELVADHVTTAVANARAREEERRRAEALAELDRAKTAFFSNVSHEFRTPLTLMIGPLEDVLRGEHGGAVGAIAEQVELAHRNAIRLLKLVNSLLDFARLEAGRIEAVYEPVDVAALTSEIAGTFRSAIERAGLRFVVECSPLAGEVHVDVEMWEKVVLNLLSNALKFTFEGQIALALRNLGDAVELEVSDTGTGIPSAELPNLFKRFHRIQGARSRTHEGSGIGLALVHDLVRLHGGDIRCESVVDQGTSFKVRIPFGVGHLPKEQIGTPRTQASTAVRAEAFVAEAQRWLPDASASERAALDPSLEETPAVRATSGMRVLVADDNADMRDYLKRILGRYWSVETVADGVLALEAARARRPDLVLADVMMPRLDGFGLLSRLRTDESMGRVPVVMLSARAGEESRIEGLDAGADDYLIKPFSARELVARVNSQLMLGKLRADEVTARRRAEMMATELEKTLARLDTTLTSERLARREADLQREHLHRLLMQAPAPICILRGPDFVIELANTFACQVWGRQHSDVIGRPLFEALPEIRAQVFKELLQGVLSTGEPYIGKEIPANLGEALPRRTVFLNFVYAPLEDVDGRVDGVLVIGFDVTDEVRARDALANTIRQNELFAGVLAHDLRNPLAAILTTARALTLQPAKDEKLAGAYRRIIGSGERMARMIDQLLDFARIRSGGGIPVERRSVNLEEIARRVIGEVESAHAGRKFGFETVGSAVGEWDPDRLAQVVSNLAGNAVQHGDADGPLVARIDARSPETVTLAIENGGTIAAELLPVLFDPFRGTKNRQRNATGLGLGLFISKEVIAGHGGDLQVISKGQTTSFQVVLPRGTAPAETAQ